MPIGEVSFTVNIADVHIHTLLRYSGSVSSVGDIFRGRATCIIPAKRVKDARFKILRKA